MRYIILQKSTLYYDNGRGYLYPNLCYIVSKMPLPTQNMRWILKSLSHFPGVGVYNLSTPTELRFSRSTEGNLQHSIHTFCEPSPPDDPRGPLAIPRAVRVLLVPLKDAGNLISSTRRILHRSQRNLGAGGRLSKKVTSTVSRFTRT